MFEATISAADTVLMALAGCRAVVGIVCGRSAVPVVDAVERWGANKYLRRTVKWKCVVCGKKVFNGGVG